MRYLQDEKYPRKRNAQKLHQPQNIWAYQPTKFLFPALQRHPVLHLLFYQSLTILLLTNIGEVGKVWEESFVLKGIFQDISLRERRERGGENIFPVVNGSIISAYPKHPIMFPFPVPDRLQYHGWMNEVDQGNWSYRNIKVLTCMFQLEKHHL